MNQRRHSNSAILALVGLIALAPNSSHAAPVETTPYVFLGATHDDNLFRLSDDVLNSPELADSDPSDNYYSLGAGFNSDWRYSRQEFSLNGEIYRSQFDRFDQLDYTGGNLNAAWNWIRGSLWDGQIAYHYDRSLKSFSNMLVPRRDIKTRNIFDIEAGRLLNPRWRLDLRGSYRDTDFSYSTLNHRTGPSARAGMSYISRSDNRAGLELGIADMRFPNRDNEDILHGLDDGYLQSNLDAIADWSISGKSRLDFRLGYTNRKQDNIRLDDFDGPTGRIIHFWSPTGKTTVRSSIWRELSTLGDEIANYAIVTGIGSEIEWKFRHKFSFLLSLDYENQDFQDNVEAIGNSLPHREDDVFYGLFGLRYNPREYVSLTLDYEKGDRRSTRLLRDYEYNSLSLILAIKL